MRENNFEDVRIRKSKNKLKKALLELMKTQKFEKISVCEICEKAEINRMTFYNHYKDKFELFKDAMTDVGKETRHRFQQELVIYDITNTVDSLLHLFEVATNEAIKFQYVFRSISGSENYQGLSAKMLEGFEIFIFNLLSNILKKDLTTAKFETKFFTAGMSSLITYHINHRSEIDDKSYYAYAKELIEKFIA